MRGGISTIRYREKKKNDILSAVMLGLGPPPLTHMRFALDGFILDGFDSRKGNDGDDVEPGAQRHQRFNGCFDRWKGRYYVLIDLFVVPVVIIIVIVVDVAYFVIFIAVHSIVVIFIFVRILVVFVIPIVVVIDTGQKGPFCSDVLTLDGGSLAGAGTLFHVGILGGLIHINETRNGRSIVILFVLVVLVTVIVKVPGGSDGSAGGTGCCFRFFGFRSDPGPFDAAILVRIPLLTFSVRISYMYIRDESDSCVEFE